MHAIQQRPATRCRCRNRYSQTLATSDRIAGTCFAAEGVLSRTCGEKVLARQLAGSGLQVCKPCVIEIVHLPVRFVPEEPVDMALFQWRARLDPLLDIEQQVDRLLASMQFPFPVVRFDRPFPPVNVYELDHEYLVVVEAPGVLAQSLDIFVHEGVLLLRGERPSVPGVSDERYRRHERHLGRWERSVPLPDRCDHDRIAAEFAEGILRIHLPKLVETKPRQIRVSGNAPQESDRQAIHTIHPTGPEKTSPEKPGLETTVHAAVGHHPVISLPAAAPAATIHPVATYPGVSNSVTAHPEATRHAAPPDSPGVNPPHHPKPM